MIGNTSIGFRLPKAATQKTHPIFQWKPEDVVLRIKLHTYKGLRAAGMYVARECMKKLKRPQPLAVAKKSGRRYGLDPSLPWEDAKRMEGIYSKSIVFEVYEQGDAMWCLVGSDIKYAARLEFGFIGNDSRGRTYNQAPRPTIRRTVHQSIPMVGRFLVTGGRR